MSKNQIDFQLAVDEKALEEITSDVSIVANDEELDHLTPEGLAEVGTHVVPGMILIGGLRQNEKYDRDKLVSFENRYLKSEDDFDRDFSHMYDDLCIRVPENLTGIVASAVVEKLKTKTVARVTITVEPSA